VHGVIVVDFDIDVSCLLDGHRLRLSYPFPVDIFSMFSEPSSFVSDHSECVRTANPRSQFVAEAVSLPAKAVEASECQ
jgi:hypothetical protein